jgi:hypothetical protein
MDSLVWHPAAAQVLPSPIVGEGGGVLPGRLPFIDPLKAQRLLCNTYSSGLDQGFPQAPKNFVAKA